MIAYSPWLDMALRGKTLETNAATDALVGKPILEAMAGMFLGGATDPLNPLANPLENDFTGFPPLYINCGGAETLQSDSETLAAKAKAQGVKVTLSVVPGMQHVFPALAGRAPRPIRNWRASPLGIARSDPPPRRRPTARGTPHLS